MSIWRESRSADRRQQGASAISGQAATATHPGTDLEFGHWVGEYVIVRKLGEGGFGAVYEALHPVIGKRAAVKVLHAQYSADESVTSRFAAEARAVNQIRHRNIVDIFAFGELPDRRQYYVMELLEGVPLDSYLDRATRLEVTECLAILSEIAKALQAAHDAGIAHRDLKPENVFLQLDDEQIVHPKILDFGMAKLLAPGSLPVHKTRSGAPIGSPRYMSPEQCRGVPVDHRTDVYAFGCMAYRMLAGVPPFDAATALELMMAHVSAPPTPLSSVGPDLGPRVDEALLKMLEKLPENRPQTITAAYESLKAAAQARAPELASISAWPASPLLMEMAEQRRSVATTPIDVSKLPRTPDNSHVVAARSRPFWLWPLVSLGLAGLLYYGLQHRDAKRSVAVPSPTSGPALAAAAPPPGPSSPSASVESIEQVAITIQAQPPKAELWLGNERVGVAPGPVSLPKGEASVTLVVKAPGYLPASTTVIPTGNKTIRVSLVPQKPRSGGKLSRDLEDPY